MASPLSSSLDQALDLIAPYGPTLKNGNSNHAPMVVEALCALGHPEAVMPWLARYRERMELRPPPSAPIGRQEWPAMLGRRERFSDWALFFQRELDEEPWPVVLDRWVERLASGFCAAATHGVIRVGHAVRALGAAETASRRRELADALASWASTWQRLPATERSHPGTAAPREAIRRVPVVPPDRQHRRLARGPRRAGRICSGCRLGRCGRSGCDADRRFDRAVRPCLPGECAQHPDRDRFYPCGHEPGGARQHPAPAA